MLDSPLRKLLDPPVNRIGAAVARGGVPANAVTLVGFVIGLTGAAALAFEAHGWALALILINRAFDGLDGAVARHSGITDLGGYLDIVLDFLFYSAVVFGFAVGRPEDALAAAFLIFSFVGTGSSFLAFAVMAEKRNISTRILRRKSLHYIGGLTEGTETIIVFVLICLFPDQFAWIAWIFGTLCWLTTAGRIHAAWDAFR